MPLRVVVLPAPLAPMRHTSSPCSTVRSIPLTAWMPPYATCRRLSWSKGTADIGSLLDVQSHLAPQVSGDHLGVVLHFGSAPFGDLAAVVQNQHAIADAHHQFHVVLDQQDGDPVVPDVLQQPLQALSFGRIHPSRGFVEC